jgi:ankyrin repeat protein
MKFSLSVLAFLLCFSAVYSNTDTVQNNTSLEPIKIGVKNPRNGKSSNSFTNSNPYKMNTFCQLIQAGNFKAVHSLIKNGADINKESIKLTPLMYAARHNRAEIVQLLIENGADLHIRSSRKGYTALKWAKLSDATESYNIINAALKKKR